MNKAGKFLAWCFVITLHSSFLISCPIQKVEKKIRVPFQMVDDGLQDIKFIQPNGEGFACPETYRGVGFRTNWGTMMITEIAPGSPAAASGLQVGDRVLEDIDFKSLPVDTLVTVNVERYDKQFSYQMKITNICYEKVP